MPEKNPLAVPRDVQYLYDGSLSGFYSCVHESVYTKTLPESILPEEDSEPTLLEQKTIPSDPKKARLVRGSIPQKISPRALELVETVFLSCLPHKELASLRFLLKGYQTGPEIIRRLSDPDVDALVKAEKHLLGEAHLFLGFVRFSDYDGALAAVITPKNFILPFIARHFVNRYSNENFLIYDKTHKTALIYENKKIRLVPLENMEFFEPTGEEQRFRSLWKQFYSTIAIEERYNPKCRMTHMPKRYWENMTEMRDLL